MKAAPNNAPATGTKSKVRISDIDEIVSRMPTATIMAPVVPAIAPAYVLYSNPLSKPGSRADSKQAILAATKPVLEAAIMAARCPVDRRVTDVFNEYVSAKPKRIPGTKTPSGGTTTEMPEQTPEQSPATGKTKKAG
ncbi:MAG: hypothetical protein KDA44_21000 [Planctomycetales bacterium]|nr:hypothetical protein [Planctomycetales bacterium]